MIIGFVGFIGGGKGTVGQILERKGFVKDSFAAPVKDAVSVIFGWERELLEGETEKSRVFRETPDIFWSERFGEPFSPRKALQLMGTEAGRNVFHKDLWALSFLRRVQSETRNVIVTDVRFPNEIDIICKTGGRVFHIQRGELPFYFYGARRVNFEYNFQVPVEEQTYTQDGKSVHYSEWAWIGHPLIDPFVIKNDGSLEDLEKTVYNVVGY